MYTSKSPLKTQRSREAAIMRWVNEGGSLMPERLIERAAPASKPRNLKWLAGSAMNLVFGKRRKNISGSKSISTPICLSDGLKEHPTLRLRSVARSRSRRGRAAARVRAVSGPGYDLISLH